MAGAAVVVILIMVLVSGGGGGSDTSSPEGAVRAWFERASSGDCEGVVEVSTESSWGGGGLQDRIAQCESVSAAMGVGQGGGGPQLSVEGVEVLSEDESSANVQVDVALGGPALTTSANLVNQDGQWQVDVGSSFPELGLGEAGGLLPGA